jgi:hypothetical protein
VDPQLAFRGILAQLLEEGKAKVGLGLNELGVDGIGIGDPT